MKHNQTNKLGYLDYDEKDFLGKGENFLITRVEGFDTIATKLHEHNFGEVFFLLEGSITYVVENGCYVLKPYDCLFIPPHTLHQLIVNDKQSEFKRIILWIYTDFIDEMSTIETNLNEQLWKFTGEGNYLVRDIDFGVNFKTHLEKIIELKAKEMYGKDILIRNELSAIFLSISRFLIEGKGTKINKEGNQYVIKVIEYIGNHLKEDLKNSDIADHVGLDEYYLSHLFSKVVGVTIHQYVIKKRLAVAKKMLDKNMALKDIAPEVGFKDTSHFVQSFKKEYGITPNKYKQIINQRVENK